ncbi:hypothetical protein BGZ73_000437 [Actinomortierella ambigua]|nr:hypothetical protein BGZ73_000437 [Actinomortierella ambigua]
MDRAFRDQIRTLGEDAVSYVLYVSPRPHADVNSSVASDSQAVFETLQVTKALALSIAQRLTKGYIWHQDSFSLRIDSGKRLGMGSMDDEWMIVYLLREITRLIPGTIARIWDNDGEFLLIEAADHIPNWLDPENSENRVFIYEGNLHIISPPTPSEKEGAEEAERGSRTKPPQLVPALNLIRRVNGTNMADGSGVSVKTIATPEIQQAAFGPVTETFAANKIQEQKHYARCKVPWVVARLLRARPELVTRACNAFYTRDALGLAACSRMDKFLPIEAATKTAATTNRIQLPPAEAQRRRVEQARMVTTAVCFTRTCYAQLVSQPFQPPKSWSGIVPPSDPVEARDTQKVKEAELGMKLTCGFEILCSPDFPGDFGWRSGEEIQLEQFPFASDYDWRVFKSTLSFRQYFGNERPGSQEYRRLEDQAKRQFLEGKMERDREDRFYSNSRIDQSSSGGAGAGQESQSADSTELDSHTTSFFGHGYDPVEQIERLLEQWGKEDMGDKFEQVVDDRPDDDASWMTVSLADLEAMMHAKGLRDPSLGSGAHGKNQGDSDDMIGMEDVLGKFESFVQQGRGGVEGAEFLDEQSDEDSDSDEDSKTGGAVKISEYDNSDHDNGVVDGGDDDDDDDIFASDYEERVAERRARRSGKSSVSASLFVFDDHVSGGQPENTSKDSTSQRLTLSADNIQRILADKFGVTRSTLPARDSLSHENRNIGMADEQVREGEEDQDIRRYMAELDAELAGTSIGESFEKTVPIVPQSKNQVKNKGKGRVEPPAKAEMHGHASIVELDEKTLKTNTQATTKTTLETIEESIARTKRGQTSRRGGSMDGRMYGYDPMAGDVEDSSDDEFDATAHQEITGKTGREQQKQYRRRKVEEEEVVEEEEEEEEEAQASEVNVDLNLAKNLLESFKSQGGLPGPSSNLLGRLGIVLPRDDEGDEDESDGYKDVAYEDEESDDGDPRF